MGKTLKTAATSLCMITALAFTPIKSFSEPIAASTKDYETNSNYELSIDKSFLEPSQFDEKKAYEPVRPSQYLKNLFNDYFKEKVSILVQVTEGIDVFGLELKYDTEKKTIILQIKRNL